VFVWLEEPIVLPIEHGVWSVEDVEGIEEDYEVADEDPEQD
jgi:hypothetical protein